jgi:MFS transporter, DHA2 family, multidrug resistance protein
MFRNRRMETEWKPFRFLLAMAAHLIFERQLNGSTPAQTARLFGAELGTAFVQTFVRVSEQTYSNLIGLHVTTGSLLTDQRLQDYARAVTGRSVGQSEANARATALLARAVQDQANVLAYIDGFMIIGFAAIGALLLMLLLRAPPAQPKPSERAAGAPA